MSVPSIVRLLLLCFSALLTGIAVYSLYRYEIRLTSFSSILIYCVIPLALAAAQWATTKLTKANMVLVFVIEVALFSGAYGAEIYLQYFDRISVVQKKRNLPALISNLESLLASPEKFYPIPLIRPDIVPPAQGIRHSIFTLDGNEILPLAGISNVPTVFCAEARDSFLTYNSDRYGFNNHDSVWDLATIDVAALGDSFTHGTCVEPNEHMVGIIRNKLPATLNLGRLGTGPLSQLAILREYLAPKKPKSVIWFLEESNDIWGDLHDELKIAILRKYLDPGYSQDLSSKQPQVDGLLKDVYADKIESEVLSAKASLTKITKIQSNVDISMQSIIRVAKLSNVRGLVGLGIDPEQNKVIEKLYQEYELILRDAHQAVDAWGGTIYLVFLQSKQKYTSWQHDLSYAKQRERVFSIADKIGIKIIDTTPIFDAHPDPLSLFQGHYTPEGYNIVGNLVLQTLANEGRTVTE